MVNIPKPVLIGSAIGSTCLTALLLKDIITRNDFKDEELSSAEDKVVIITGANTGIGRQTALGLAKKKAKVIMACRDIAKCETAREEIVLQTKNKHVYCRKCDLASQDSIRKFVERFKKEHERLDILINNAAVMRCPNWKTEDGIEMQLGVNHMGHFLLTNLLLDKLKKSVPSRVINVSSISHLSGKINKDDLNSEKNYEPGTAYNQSKLANVLFTVELATKLKGTGVTVNAVHPGLVSGTEITRHMESYDGILNTIFLKPILWMFEKTPDQGAEVVLHAALSPTLDQVSGKYLEKFKESNPSSLATDTKLAKWLWLTSEKWTKLSSEKEVKS